MEKQENVIKQMLHPYKIKMASAVFLSAIGQFCGVVPFILLYFIIDTITSKTWLNTAQSELWYLITAGLVAILIRYICVGFSIHLAHSIAYNVLYDLRIAIAKKLSQLPLGFFTASSSGQIKKVMLEDVEQMEIFIGHNIPEILGGLLYLSITVIVLFIFDWRLAIATICLLPLSIIAQGSVMKKAKPLQEKYFSASENANTAMIQYIQGISVIKVFGKTIDSFAKYTESVQECAKYEMQISKLWSFPSSFSSVMSNAALLLLLPVGGLLYINGLVGLPTLALFLLMGLGIGNFLAQCILLGMFMNINMEGAARINSLLQAQTLPESSKPTSIEEKSINIKNIDFAYELNEKKALECVNLSIPRGDFIALVGPSGAGKTTLARLIPRFWDVQSGSICMGNADIREVALTSLMNEMTFIFQDAFLFNESIYENICMGKPNATKDEVETAAKAACCHDFILELPEGYNSLVGEKGAKLSGGEKQRISLARAFLKNAPIVVMDEATASMDIENQALVQKAIDALIKQKTLIVIAHRLSTIVHAKTIVVVDEGKIVATGTHAELLQNSVLYQNLWQAYTSSKDWALRNALSA